MPTMTLPSKGFRSIVVAGQSYLYRLSGGKGRYIGTSGPNLRFQVILKPKEAHDCYLLSKLWDPDLHEDAYALHKVTFTPKDASNIIRAILRTGTIPTDLDLPNWEVTKPRKILL